MLELHKNGGNIGRQMYKLATDGKTILVWCGAVDAGCMTCASGQMDGTITPSITHAEPKNVGRANETSAAEQAVIEMEAKYRAQYKNKHYRLSIEDAQAQAEVFIPMKLQNYKDHSKKIDHTDYYVQKKFNGSRRTYYNFRLLSKIGREEVSLLEHLNSQMKMLREERGIDLDGEVYLHGKSLQQIRSLSLTIVDESADLNLVIFDIPDTNIPWTERIGLLRRLARTIRRNPLKYPNLSVELPVHITADTDEEGRLKGEQFREEAVANGYEGIVYRTPDSMYETNGKKSYDTQKSKPRYDSEAFVEGIEKCKNGTAKLLCRTSDSMGSIKFKCMMKVKRRDGNEYPRDPDSMQQLVGGWITYSYEELSDKGVPTKPVGEFPRKCDTSGTPTE